MSDPLQSLSQPHRLRVLFSLYWSLFHRGGPHVPPVCLESDSILARVIDPIVQRASEHTRDGDMSACFMDVFLATLCSEFTWSLAVDPSMTHTAPAARIPVRDAAVLIEAKARFAASKPLSTYVQVVLKS